MLSFKQFITETRFIHGTVRDNIPSIKQNYLQPGVSDYTRQFYDDPQPKLFLAKDHDVERATSSIYGQVARKLNKHISKVSSDEIEKHGALVTTRADDYDVKTTDDDYDPPEQAESGDYYTDDDLKPTGFMTGKRLVSFLQKHKSLR